MGMGAPKQGSTLPPQGGKGGVQQPVQPQVPARREGLGQMFPNYTFPRGPSVPLNPNATPYTGPSNQPAPRPQVQPPTPAPGGKTAAPGTIFNPNNPNNVPMPGGKGAVQPGQPPYMPIGLPPSQPGQVPAQGGKGRDFGPNVFPGPQQPFIEPMRDQNPQVAEMIRQGNMQGAMDLQKQLAMQNGKIFPQQPQVQQPFITPMQPFDPRQAQVYAPYINKTVDNVAQRPQVLPMKPMPANMAPQQVGLGQAMQGLGGLGGLTKFGGMM